MTKATARFRLEGEDATAQAFRSALGRAQSFSKQAGSLFKGAFVGLSVASVASVIGKTIELGDELNKAAVKAGVTGRAMSELAYAAKQSDIDVQSLSGALQKMQVNLNNARAGGKAQTETLTALGLSIQDVISLDADRQFELLGDRISQLKDPTDRARAAVELFGKSGADLLPLFQQGAAGIRAAREESVRLGQSFSDEQIKRLADADDAIKRLTGAFKGMATVLVAEVAPGLAQFFDNITAIATGDRIGKLKEQIDFLERMKGRSFVAAGYGDIGTGFFSAEEGAAKLEELQQRLTALTRTRGRGGVGGRPSSALLPGFEKAPEQARNTAAVIGKAFEQIPYEFNFEIDPKDLENTRGDFLETFNDIEATAGDAFQNVSDAFAEASSEMSVYGEEAARRIQNSLADLFKGGSDGVRGFGRAVIDTFRDILANKAAKELADLFASFGAGGSRAGSGGFLGSLFGGLFGAGSLFGFANGGQFKVGGSGGTDSQLVAFRASPNETVTVTRPDQRMGGASIVINNSIDARGATQELAAKLPAILRENNRKMFDELDRRFGLAT